MSLREKKEAIIRPVNTEFTPLIERPKIARSLESIPKVKFGTLGIKSTTLALEVYRELEQSGLYLENTPNDFLKTILSVYNIFEKLINDYDQKGKIVANHLGTILGIKIVSDKKLMKLGERRKYILNMIGLDAMQFGLNSSMYPNQIMPENFFDQKLDKNSKLNKADTLPYYLIVKQLEKIQKKYKDDDLVVSWCAMKLRQLEEFETSLEAKWLAFSGVKVNKKLAGLKKDKASIYKREKTKPVSK